MSEPFESSFVQDRPRVGFLGAGWIGRMRLEALVDSGVANMVAIVEPSQEAQKKAKEIVPRASLRQSYNDLLEMGLDGIVIATPSALHAEQAAAALRSGHAVFCEKPLALTAAQTRGVLDIARAADRLLAVDFSYRFTAGLAKIRELTRAGMLGEVYAVDLVFHNSYGPDKAWFYDLSLSGGGCVIDLGIHLIDAALWMLDFPAIKAVKSHLFERGKPLPLPVVNATEDYAVASVELDSGAVVRMACSWQLPIGQDAFIQAVFHGTRGGAELRNVGGSFYDFRADLYQGRNSVNICTPPDQWGGRALVHWAARLASENRFDPAVDNLSAVARVIDAIYGRDDAESITS